MVASLSDFFPLLATLKPHACELTGSTGKEYTDEKYLTRVRSRQH